MIGQQSLHANWADPLHDHEAVLYLTMYPKILLRMYHGLWEVYRAHAFQDPIRAPRPDE